MDSVTLSLYCKSIGKNNTRSKNIRKYSDTINWENISFPPTEDYKQLETNNENIKLNVLELNDNQIFDYVYRSRLDNRKNKVNLLLLEKKHYIYIKKLVNILNYSPKSESESESDSSQSIKFLIFLSLCIYTVLNKLVDNIFCSIFNILSTLIHEMQIHSLFPLGEYYH